MDAELGHEVASARLAEIIAQANPHVIRELVMEAIEVDADDALDVKFTSPLPGAVHAHARAFAVFKHCELLYGPSIRGLVQANVGFAVVTARQIAVAACVSPLWGGD